jgi:hypothetical protein
MAKVEIAIQCYARPKPERTTSEPEEFGFLVSDNSCVQAGMRALWILQEQLCSVAGIRAGTNSGNVYSEETTLFVPNMQQHENRQTLRWSNAERQGRGIPQEARKMSVHKQPTITQAKTVSEQCNASIALVITLWPDGTIAGASYGQDQRLCGRGGQLLDSIINRLCHTGQVHKPAPALPCPLCHATGFETAGGVKVRCAACGGSGKRPQ